MQEESINFTLNRQGTNIKAQGSFQRFDVATPVSLVRTYTLKQRVDERGDRRAFTKNNEAA